MAVRDLQSGGFAIIGVMIAQDPGLLHAKPIRAEERAVSATVLMALIASTTI